MKRVKKSGLRCFPDVCYLQERIEAGSGVLLTGNGKCQPYSNYVKSPLNQNQYDALCSFIFNIGATDFKGSTMLKLLNQANYKGASEEFPKWKRSGNDPDILLPRRQREQALFLS